LADTGVVVLSDQFSALTIAELSDSPVLKRYESEPFQGSDSYRELRGAQTRGSRGTFIRALQAEHYIDWGIVDVHNIDISQLPVLKCINFFPLCFDIVEAAFPRLFAFDDTHCNLYSYTNVATPRAFHRDTMKPRVKCFLPLSPVSDIKQGPYGVVPGSFRSRFGALSEYLVNSVVGSDLGNSAYDATFVSSRSVVPLFVKPGDLYITRQDCVHGDFPATVQFSRKALVVNLFCK
jgi:hypothetical protein